MGFGLSRWQRIFLSLGCGSFLLLACTRNPTEPTLALPVEVSYQGQGEVSYWLGGKRAAVSVAFDDARASHWQLAAPTLEEYGFRGTFNLNTGCIRNWEPWIRLFEHGHEIGSHTRSHPDLAKISLDEAEEEMRRSLQDLASGIPGLARVVSFCYPYGSSTPELRAIGSRYFVCQRAINGRSATAINCRPVTRSTLSCARGYGVYPPYDSISFGPILDETIRCGGWIIIYWHSLSMDGPFTSTVAPYGLFRDLMDELEQRSDSIWVATQAEIARYVLEREQTRVTVRIQPDGRALAVSLSDVYTGLPIIPLTVCLRLPRKWQSTGTKLRLRARFPRTCRRKRKNMAEIQIAPGETVEVQAFHE